MNRVGCVVDGRTDRLRWLQFAGTLQCDETREAARDIGLCWWSRTQWMEPPVMQVITPGESSVTMTG